MSEEWNHLLKKYFRGKVKGQTEKIRNAILVVDNSLKPGYLVDFSVINVDNLVNFLEELSALKLTSNNLKLLILDQDFVIFNTKYYNICSVQNAEEMIQRLKFIDVSASLCKPEVMSDETLPLLKDVMAVVFENNEREDKVYTVNCADVNLTTLFGVLIGYPVVYWFSIQGGQMDNCLGMVSLKHVEVTGTQNNGGSYTIYSFSFPDCLSSDLEQSVQHWYDAWKSDERWTTLFTSVNITYKSVTLPAVNL